MQPPACVHDFRARAQARLPSFLFGYVDGGSFGERTLRDNEAAWARWKLRQHVLRDVSNLEVGATLLGQAANLPLALAPLGLAGLLSRRGEAQAARAAEAAGVPFCTSTRAQSLGRGGCRRDAAAHLVSSCTCCAIGASSPRCFRARQGRAVLGARVHGRSRPGGGALAAMSVTATSALRPTVGRILARAWDVLRSRARWLWDVPMCPGQPSGLRQPEPLRADWPGTRRASRLGSTRSSYVRA